MKSLAELQAIKDRMKNNIGVRADVANAYKILVGMATCGIAAGARPVLTEFNNEIAKRGISNAVVSQTGCIGICQYEPVVEVIDPNGEKVTYVKVTVDKVARIITDHIVNGNVVSEYTIGNVAK